MAEYLFLWSSTVSNDSVFLAFFRRFLLVGLCLFCLSWNHRLYRKMIPNCLLVSDVKATSLASRNIDELRDILVLFARSNDFSPVPSSNITLIGGKSIHDSGFLSIAHRRGLLDDFFDVLDREDDEDLSVKFQSLFARLNIIVRLLCCL